MRMSAPFVFYHSPLRFVPSYDIFAINIASVMLGYVYGAGNSPAFKLTNDQDLGIKVATPVGTFVGQLLFGWLADIVGRKKMCKFMCFLPWRCQMLTSRV
jgi:MFS family permease